MHLPKAKTLASHQDLCAAARHAVLHAKHSLEVSMRSYTGSPALLTPATRAGVQHPAMGANTTGLDMPSRDIMLRAEAGVCFHMMPAVPYKTKLLLGGDCWRLVVRCGFFGLCAAACAVEQVERCLPAKRNGLIRCLSGYHSSTKYTISCLRGFRGFVASTCELAETVLKMCSSSSSSSSSS
jgi:hypothetical protein